jgi:hypothetical protein
MPEDAAFERPLGCPERADPSIDPRDYGLADRYIWIGFVAGVTEADDRSFAAWPGVRVFFRPVQAAELAELGPEFGEATTVLVFEHCDFDCAPTGHRHRIFLRRVERPR